MADYDRGAYTPQTDAPLAFDPRRPSELRPMPMALIGSAVVLVVLLAGVAMVYRNGVRHAGEAPRPVGEPVMSVKTAAPDADVHKAAPPSLDVYNAANATGSAPIFTPPTEQPAARPAPRPSTLAMLAKPQAAAVRRPTPAQSEVARAAEDAQVKPLAPAEPVIQARSTPRPPAASASSAHTTAAAKASALDNAEVAAAGMTRASGGRTSLDDAAAAQAAPAKAAPALRQPPPAESAEAEPVGSVVQIGAFSSDALATKGYADVSTAMVGQMGGKSRHVEPLQHDGKTLYRTWVGGFASHTDAKAFCDALKAKGKICIVKG